MANKTLRERLKNFKNDPTAFWIKFLQGGIDHLQNFSYNFEKNGEKALLQALKNHPIHTVFDVGSNVGDWSLIARSFFPHANIHSFEISPATFKTLRNNTTKKNIIINNLGLGNQDTEIEFKDYGTDSTVNTILLNTSYHDHKIKPKISKSKIKKGDSYCLENNIDCIDLLKIDVEGAEHLVLEGFSQMINQKKIGLIQFEYGYANGDARFLMRDFYNLLNNAGYIIGKLKKNGVAFQPWSYKLNDFRSGPNFIAIRGDDTPLLKIISKF